jgi:AraC-like DNA-binding protein
VSNTSDLLITGPCAKSVKVPHSTDCYYFAVEFKPLIFKSLFDFKTSLTVDKIVYASEIIGEDNKETLLHQLSGSKSGKSIQQVFEEFFKSYLIKSITFDIDVFKAIELLNKTNGKEKIENIYKKVSIGKRQFQRNFLTETGITLKEFARIIRVRAAADEVVKGTADPSDIIYDFGFYDQSHYYKEFKIFSGVNPTIFAERQKKLTRQSR